MEDIAATQKQEVCENDSHKHYEPAVKGEKIDLPKDLYIPPDALEVFLDTFQGPLDLLLYLIKKQNMDILDIPIADITVQYMEYVEIMKDMHLELAGEYLLMAAILAEIKSRILLPRSNVELDEEEDPRAELVRHLQEYERFKNVSEELANLPRQGLDIFVGHASAAIEKKEVIPPKLEMKELVSAFMEILQRSSLLATHKVQKEGLSIRERMSEILEKLEEKKHLLFQDCFDVTEGRIGIVVSFLAILELLKATMIDLVQTASFGPIHLKVIESESN